MSLNTDLMAIEINLIPFVFLFRAINNFNVCFKICNLSAVGKKSATKELADNVDVKGDPPSQPDRQISVHSVMVQTLDDVTFQLSEKNDPKSLLKKVSKVLQCNHLSIHSVYISLPSQNLIS